MMSNSKILLIITIISIFVSSQGHPQPTNTTQSQNGINREAKFFPFHTIGRFKNTVCTATNNLQGTCDLGGACDDNGGIPSGSGCAATKQAICCVYSFTCGASTIFNNTYFYNPGFPNSYTGSTTRCSLTVNPCSSAVCQARIDFLDFSLAPPNGDGVCATDYVSISGGSSQVPLICGENTGQHVYVDFSGTNSITVEFATTPSYSFNRHWHLKVSQINCDSQYTAPSGCLQYYTAQSTTVRSFNYAPSANANLNSVDVEGGRQMANLQYGICVRMGAGMCSITWTRTSSDLYSFTVTGDVGAVDPTLLGTATVQSTSCTTDYIIIPNAMQGGALLPSDRICGLGMAPTTSDPFVFPGSVRPFVLYAITDDNETGDVSNRGFSLVYSQNLCPLV